MRATDNRYGSKRDLAEFEAKTMKNECGKTRDVDNPYEVWENEETGWTWHVLKKYQRPDKEATNPHARWFVAAKSPYTYGSWEYGDTYVSDVKTYGAKVK